MLIIMIPGLNSMGKSEGCENAGKAIFESLEKLGSNEQGKVIDKKLMNFEEIKVNRENLEEQQEKIYERALKFLENENKVIFLGGDHSISFSIGKAFLEHCKNEDKEPCLIVFDSHADCCVPGKEPTHEEWLRALIENGFPAKNVLLVGVRNIWQEELVFLNEKKIRRIGVNELSNNIEEMMDIIMEFASGKLLYVSFDIDVVDPAFAPSTGYKEAGGLTGRQMIYIASRLSKMKNLKALDIVEVNSKEDVKVKNMTVNLAGKILGELL